MGFKPARTVYTLQFADGDFEGLEVKARSAPLGQVMELITLAEGMGDGTGISDAAAMAAARQLLLAFADVLISWNVENDDDTPVPATYEGMKAQELPLILRMVEAWIGAVAGPPAAPLAQPSSGGSLSLAESLPMEQLSGSQAS